MEDVNVILPGEVGGVAVRDDLDDLAVDGDCGVAGGFDIGVEDSEGGIVLEEVRSLLDASGVVDGDDVERRVFASVPASKEVPSDSTESVDGYLQFCFCYSFPVSSATPNLNNSYSSTFTHTLL